jgi:MFS family permease
MATTPLGPGYARLLSAVAFSSLGDGIRKAAIPLLAAALTSNPALVAGAAVAGQLPWLLFGLVAGGIVDRTNRRVLVAVVDVVRLVLLAVLVFALAVDAANLALLYLIAFACGIGETLRDTATTTMVLPLVSADNLDRANGRLINAEVTGNEMLGPPIGGYLFGGAIALPFVVNSATLAVAAALVFSMSDVFSRASRQASGGAGLGHEIRDGVRWLTRHRELRTIAVMGAIFALVDGAWFAILVLYAQQILGLPPNGFGLLITVGGLGGLAGGFVAPSLTRRLGHGTVLVAAILAAAVSQAAMALTSDTVIAGGALTVSSAAFAVWNVASMTLRQRLTPEQLQGRVTGAYRTLLMGAEPVGALLGGITASLLGLRAPLLLGVPILVITAFVGYRTVAGKRFTEGDDPQ